MIPGRSTPPRFAERMLSAILGTERWTESILGDLHEEYARAGRGVPALAKPRADVWYCLQALALGARCAGALARPRDCHARTERSPSPRQLTEIPSCARSALETRYAFRTLLKRPGLSALVILTLALGLGANAAVFANIDALILRPFTMHDVDRVMMVAETSPHDGIGTARDGVARRLPRLEAADRRLRAAGGVRMVGREPGRHRRAGAGRGLPRLGRLLSGAGRRAGARAGVRGRRRDAGRHRRAIIGHGLWQRRFAGRPRRDREDDPARWRAVRGRRRRAAGFDFPMGAQIWAPLSFDAARGQLGAAPISHRRRPAGARAIARGCQGADGGDRRTARAAVSGDQSRTRRAGV